MISPGIWSASCAFAKTLQKCFQEGMVNVRWSIHPYFIQPSFCS